MKKFISILLETLVILSFVLIPYMSFSAVSKASDSTFVAGDVDMDGMLTITDATAIQRHLANIVVLTDEQQRIGMVANGTELSIIDVTMIQKKIANLIDRFPVETSEPTTKEGPDRLKIEVVVGNKIFSATLYDNAAADAFIDMLPLTLNMNELNGNEKFYYLDTVLPTNASRPSGINAGDIMLYGNSCLVLFYESFSTSYSYTPIGYLDDPTGLANALGSGSVQVTFWKG